MLQNKHTRQMVGSPPHYTESSYTTQIHKGTAHEKRRDVSRPCVAVGSEHGDTPDGVGPCKVHRRRARMAPTKPRATATVARPAAEQQRTRASFARRRGGNFLCIGRKPDLISARSASTSFWSNPRFARQRLFLSASVACRAASEADIAACTTASNAGTNRGVHFTGRRLRQAICWTGFTSNPLRYVFSSLQRCVGDGWGQFRPMILPVVRPQVFAGDCATGSALDGRAPLHRNALFTGHPVGYDGRGNAHGLRNRERSSALLIHPIRELHSDAIISHGVIVCQ